MPLREVRICLSVYVCMHVVGGGVFALGVCVTVTLCCHLTFVRGYVFTFLCLFLCFGSG